MKKSKDLIAEYTYRVMIDKSNFIDSKFSFHIRKPKWMPKSIYNFLVKEMIIFQTQQ